MGRRSKLTPEIQEKICNYIRIGNTFEVSAGAAGISGTTFYNWCKRARIERERVAKSKRRKIRKREAPFVAFLEALELAEHEGETLLVDVVASSGPEGAKWILGRRHPGRWGNKQKTEISGPDGGPIDIKSSGSLTIYEYPTDSST